MTKALSDLSTGGLRIDDTRLLVALAKFAERTDTQSRGMDQFIREVDTAAKELRGQTAAQNKTKRGADDLAGAQAAAAATTKKTSQTQQAYDELQKRSSQRWGAWKPASHTPMRAAITEVGRLSAVINTARPTPQAMACGCANSQMPVMA